MTEEAGIPVRISPADGKINITRVTPAVERVIKLINRAKGSPQGTALRTIDALTSAAERLVKAGPPSGRY